MFTPRLNPAAAPATAAAGTLAAEAPGLPLSAALTAKEQAWWLVFIALHAPLGLWMQSQSIVVWAQGTTAILIGCWWSLDASLYGPDRLRGGLHGGV